MKPPAFSYHDPRSVADAIALLGTLDNAKLLAGGQSLMPMLNMRYVLPDHVIVGEKELPPLAKASWQSAGAANAATVFTGEASAKANAVVQWLSR